MNREQFYAIMGGEGDAGLRGDTSAPKTLLSCTNLITTSCAMRTKCNSRSFTRSKSCG